MADIREIEKFVEKLFDLYHLDKEGYFYETSFEGKDFVDGRKVELYLFPFEKIDEETLNRVSIALGLTKEEIISMDSVAATRYWKKYPFFQLYAEYLDRLYWASNFSGEYQNPDERMLTAIFSDEDEPFGKRNYDHEDVINRLYDTLKEINVFMPGTYHDNAFIRQVEIENTFFFSFPRCSAMISSFLDMVSHLKELFFKTIYGELKNEEINEMNFLATWLCAVDSFIPNSIITYDFVKKLSKVYESEGENDFFHYVKIKSFIRTRPWQCKEFFDYKDLVQQFVIVFPQAKSMMLDFSMKVKNYSCVYEWSDAEPIQYDSEEDADLIYFDQIMGLDDIPLEERPREKGHIFIPKTQNEMRGWEESLNNLKIATSPTAQGGLLVPERKKIDLASSEDFSIFLKRFNAKQGVADNG